MNRFYELHIVLQWLIALLMLAATIGVFVLWTRLIDHKPYIILLIFFIIPIGQFLLTPFLKLVGTYKYLSPMLLVYSPSSKKYDLHNGTPFDYLFAFPGHTSGKNWQNRLLLDYIKGLLVIVDDIENDRLPESIVVRGSSYFFSERTAMRLGFTLTNTGLYERINIVLNYVDLLWMYSLSQGILSFPSLLSIKTASTTGVKLVEHKHILLRFKGYLQKG